MDEKNPNNVEYENTSKEIPQQRSEQGASTAPSPNSPSGAPTSSISSNQDQPNVQPSEDRIQPADKWMIGVNAAIAFFSLCGIAIAAGGVIVAYLQWDAIRGGGEQTDRLIAQVSAQAAATNQLAAAARKSLAESRDHSQRALRAYLLPTIEPGPLVQGEPIKARYYLVNYGQTPALNTYSITGVFVGRKAMQEAEKWFADQSTQIYVTTAGPPIPPGVPIGRNNDKFIPIPSKRIITAQDIATITERDYSVVITSRHIYRDGFDKTYGTETCHMMTKTWEAAYCPSHNEMY